MFMMKMAILSDAQVDRQVLWGWEGATPMKAFGSVMS